MNHMYGDYGTSGQPEDMKYYMVEFILLVQLEHWYTKKLSVLSAIKSIAATVIIAPDRIAITSNLKLGNFSEHLTDRWSDVSGCCRRRCCIVFLLSLLQITVIIVITVVTTVTATTTITAVTTRTTTITIRVSVRVTSSLLLPLRSFFLLLGLFFRFPLFLSKTKTVLQK